MSGTTDRTPKDDSFRKGLGSLAAIMFALWTASPTAPDDLDELPVRIGPGVLVLWTLIGVAVGGLASTFRLAFSGQDQPAGYLVMAPIALPLVLATTRLPVRRGRALALGLGLGLGLGVAVGLAVGLALGAVVGSYWQVFLGLSAGALLASAIYGTVARPPSTPH